MTSVSPDYQCSRDEDKTSEPGWVSRLSEMKMLEVDRLMDTRIELELVIPQASLKIKAKSMSPLYFVAN